MNYSEILKDPRWELRRREIVLLDGLRCRDCHDTDSTLNVHHIYYNYGNKPWDYNDDALITLCIDCHKLEHTRLKNIVGIEVTPEVQRLGLRAKHFEAVVFMVKAGASHDHSIRETSLRLNKVNEIQRDQFHEYYQKEMLLKEKYGCEYRDYMDSR